MPKTFDPVKLMNQNLVQNVMQAPARVKKIHYKSIIPNEYNKYTIDKIEELADTIETLGLLQPLLIKPIGNNTYSLISGHRRYEAITMLVEVRHLEGYANIDCIISDEVESDTVTKLKLHISNVSNRELSEFDKMNAIADLRDLNKQAISEGVPLKGKMRDIISGQMNLGPTQIQNYLTVADKATVEIKRALQERNITLSEAIDAIKNPKPDAAKRLLLDYVKAEQSAAVSDKGRAAESHDTAAAEDEADTFDGTEDNAIADAYREAIRAEQNGYTRTNETIKLPKEQLNDLITKWMQFKGACESIDSQVLYTILSKFERRFKKQLKYMEGVSE